MDCKFLKLGRWAKRKLAFLLCRQTSPDPSKGGGEDTYDYPWLAQGVRSCICSLRIPIAKIF
jgi:hypothetical protein